MKKGSCIVKFRCENFLRFIWEAAFFSNAMNLKRKINFIWMSIFFSGSAFGNIMFSFFDVVNDERYIRDSELDRKMVFYTFCIDWFFAFSTIGFVFLLPTQKPMARKWREEGEKTANKKTAICLLLFVCSGFGFSLVLSAFTFFEETRCLIIAGGAGCWSIL